MTWGNGATNHLISSYAPMLLISFSPVKRTVSRHKFYIPDFGIGTASRSRSTSTSLVTPSDCAWKFVSTR